MKITDIHVRDPFVLTDGGKYYLYGTRGADCWGRGSGFDVYVSDDLENFSDPIEVFSRPDGFWADKNYWAPEVHKYKNAYYMLASFKSDDACRGTQILKADSPEGPFRVHSDGPVTPRDWECLDGTLYVDPEGTPWMVFCHEWLQVKDGQMCAIRLTEDLTKAASEPVLLFHASDPVWSKKGAETFVTDGPFLYTTESGRLMMVWSSFTEKGYCEGIAYSDNGKVDGSWTHDTRLLFEEDGGHGMIFRKNDGQLCFIFHQPNNAPLERPHIENLVEKEDSLFRAE